jgi:hypothetical protein
MKVVMNGLLLVLTVHSSFCQTTNEISILFVCEHGAARSVIAAKYFEKLSRESGLNIKVDFRGLSPDSAINKTTMERLTKEGFAFGSQVPAPLSQKDIQGAGFIIALDCEPRNLSGYSGELLKYRGIPSIDNNYEMASDSIIHIVNDVLTKVRSKVIK